MEILDLMMRQGGRILLSLFALDRIQQKGKLPESLRKALKQEWVIGKWSLFKIHSCPAPTFDFKSFIEVSGNVINPTEVISEIYLDSRKPLPLSPVGARWLDILKCSVIPFDPKIRRDKLKYAYELLKDYIEPHEACKIK